MLLLINGDRHHKIKILKGRVNKNYHHFWNSCQKGIEKSLWNTGAGGKFCYFLIPASGKIATIRALQNIYGGQENIL